VLAGDLRGARRTTLFSRLNYFTRLTMWLIPILDLWPTFV